MNDDYESELSMKAVLDEYEDKQSNEEDENQVDEEVEDNPQDIADIDEDTDVGGEKEEVEHVLQLEYKSLKYAVRGAALDIIRRHTRGRTLAPFDIFDGQKTRGLGCKWMGDEAVIKILRTSRGRQLRIQPSKLRLILEALENDKLYLVSKKFILKAYNMSNERCL